MEELKRNGASAKASTDDAQGKCAASPDRAAQASGARTLSSGAAAEGCDASEPRSFSSLRGSAYVKAVRAGVPARLDGDSSAAADGVDLAAASAAIQAFLRALGHPPESDPELSETGRLVASAFHHELLSGYRQNPAEILAQSMPTQSSALVVVRGIDVTCICPHHLLPSTGAVHIGYLPNARIVGFGALAQLAHCFSRRLTLQETLCERIANALVEYLGAIGAGCIADLAPACLTCRGERPAHARVLSFAAAGRMQHDAALRAEFMSLAQPRNLDPSGGHMEPNR